MTFKRWLVTLLIAVGCFLVGVAVGRFVMPRKADITVIDIRDLVEIIERYSEASHEFDKIKEWNKQAIVEPESKEEKK